MQVKPQIKKYEQAKKSALDVETFSKNYKGKLQLDKLKSSTNIQTNWYKDRDAAEYSAKLTAAFFDHNAVIGLQFEKGTESVSSDSGKGTYRYAIWRACGTAVNLLAPPK